MLPKHCKPPPSETASTEHLHISCAARALCCCFRVLADGPRCASVVERVPTSALLGSSSAQRPVGNCSHHVQHKQLTKKVTWETAHSLRLSSTRGAAGIAITIGTPARNLSARDKLLGHELHPASRMAQEGVKTTLPSGSFAHPHHLPSPSKLPTSSQVLPAGLKSKMEEALHGAKTTSTSHIL